MVDNICAIATPYGIGAISVIRASGPEAITLVNKIFKGKELTKVKSHTIHYGQIMDNEEEID
jgi:tRNA modification GTPase